jgi:hypothetical protein
MPPPSSKYHLIFDIDKTLLYKPERQGGDNIDEFAQFEKNEVCYQFFKSFKHPVNTKPPVHSVNTKYFVYIRPFVRWFLSLAQGKAKTMSIWTNAAPQWASYVSTIIFPKTNWAFVLDRNHSINMNKPLGKLFASSDYPMTKSDTIIIDDCRMSKEINGERCINITPFCFESKKEAQTANLDFEFVKLAYKLGWVTFKVTSMNFKSQKLEANKVSFYDPEPFGLANQKMWCYFNSITQCMLRVPTFMRNIDMSIVKWFKMVKQKMGEGMNDASEALMVLIHPILNTPSQQVESGPKDAQKRKIDSLPKDEQLSNRSPACMIHVLAENQSSAHMFYDYFSWKPISQGGQEPNVHKRIRSIWPGKFITCVVMVVHRNVGESGGRVNRQKITPSACIMTPDNRVFHLRGIVSHSGSHASSGHYNSVFVRNDGHVWIADDSNIQECVQQKVGSLLERQATSASILFYDECGSFLNIKNGGSEAAVPVSTQPPTSSSSSSTSPPLSQRQALIRAHMRSVSSSK